VRRYVEWSGGGSVNVSGWHYKWVYALATIPPPPPGPHMFSFRPLSFPWTKLSLPFFLLPSRRGCAWCCRTCAPSCCRGSAVAAASCWCWAPPTSMRLCEGTMRILVHILVYLEAYAYLRICLSKYRVYAVRSARLHALLEILFSLHIPYRELSYHNTLFDWWFPQPGLVTQSKV